MKVIAIDIGATSGRVMTVKEEGGKISYEENNRFLNRIYEENDTLYWDFELLFNNIKEGIKLALEKNPDIRSIGIDTWAVDYGVIDKEGKLISNPICYRDTHTFKKQKEVLSIIPFEELYKKVGIQNLHFNTIYQLYKDERLKSADKILMIPDLIAYYLTGSMRLEETNASTTSLYDFKNKKIDEEILSKLNIPSSIFPSIIYPNESYGDLKDEYYPENYHGNKIEVLAVCTHDTASAVLGTDGFDKFAYLSSGTWSLLGTELKEPRYNKECMEANFTNEIGYNSTVRYLKNTMGMFLINELRDDFKKNGKEIPVSKIKEYVDSSSDIDSYLDTNAPCFETPGDMKNKIDKYLEMTGQTKPVDEKQYLRLVYQSMALSYRYLVDKLEELTGDKIDSLIIVGGGNQAVVLNQFTANALSRKVVTGPIEATVVGNATAQFLHHSIFKDVNEARKAIYNSTKSDVYFPMNDTLWEKKYKKFIQVIDHRG